MPAPTQMETFEYNPETDQADEAKNDSSGTDMAASKLASPSLARETFNGRLYSRNKLESDDAEEYIRAVTSTQQQFINFENVAPEFESPIDRFNRLKTEIIKFEEDLEELASQDSVSQVSSGSVGEMLLETEGVLGAVANDSRVAPYLATDVSLGGAALNPSTRNLASTLLSSVKGAAGSSTGSSVKAELYLKPGQRGGDRLADIDRRIAVLEQRVGGGPDSESLREAIADVHSKLELFDNYRLDSLLARVKSLLTELEIAEIQTKNQAAGASGSKALLDKLDSVMSKNDAAAKDLPALVSSLQSQKDVHEQSAQAILRLQALERQQMSLKQLLEHDKASLQAVASSFASNLQVMADNMAAFEARFKKLEGV